VHAVYAVNINNINSLRIISGLTTQFCPLKLNYSIEQKAPQTLHLCCGTYHSLHARMQIPLSIRFLCEIYKSNTSRSQSVYWNCSCVVV